MNVFAQLSLVFAYVAIVMGTLVIIRNNRDSVHRLFFLFCAGAFYWCFVEYGMRHASGMAEAQVWSKAFSFWPMPEVFMLHFVLLYSGIMKPGWRFGPLFLLYAPALAFSLLDLFTMRISSEPVLMAWGWTYGMPHTWEKSASVIWACIVTTASVGVCVWFVCAASITRRRKQGLFILCGFLIIVAAGYSTDVASFLLKRRIPEMSSLGFALGTVFIGYAIFRYNLFNLAPAAAAQEIIDTIRDILLLIDDSGTIVSANRAATALLGYGADELVGRPLEFIVALENRDSVKSLVDGRNSRPGDDHIEISLMTKQASAVLFSVSTSVVRDRQGIYQGTIFVGRDISGYNLMKEKLFLAKQEAGRTKNLQQANDAMLNLLEDLKIENKLREASENELRQSEDKFATAFRTSSYAITITHVEDGKFVEVNDGFTSIAGYTREEALADSSIGLKLWINEEDRQEVMSALRAGRIVNSREYQFRTKSGTYITGLFSAQIIRLGQGTCILSSINDITERKRMEDQLQKTNQDLDTLMSNLYSGILSTSKDDKVEHVNQAFCDLFNLSETPAGLCGLTSADMIKKIADRYADPTATIARIQEFVVRGTAVKGEEIAMRDGRFFLVDFIPIIDNDGNRCGRIWHHLDITERKQAENNQKKLEDQLRQSQKLESIGQLSSGVAHDFNNLLGGIMGHAELLKMGLDAKSDLMRHPETIISSCTKAADLTRQLLMFARKAPVEFQKMDLNDFIKQVVKLMGRTIDRSIEIVVDLQERPMIISGDRNQLENALLNMAINARDAMPGGGKLCITSETVSLNRDTLQNDHLETAEGPYVKISIADTGTGMSKETKDRIFEPFFTTKEVGKGTGLGLASVYGCVKQHNGYITVETQEGKGSQFAIYLPVAKSAEAIVSVKEEVAVIQGKGSLLVVDDEPVYHEIVNKIFGSLGYTVHCCANGPDAVTFYREHPEAVDVVILDMNMPKMNGLQCFRGLKEINPKVQVIVATGYGDNSDRQAMMKEGVCAFVQKPYRAAELAKKIKELMAA